MVVKSMFSSKAMRGMPQSTARTNQNQGGGSRKAGFPYMIGRETNASIAMGTTNAVVNNKCCNLKSYQTMAWTSYAKQSRPVGSNIMAYRIGLAR
jgi:hypothetical protein